jgi:hypothetical protein
MSEEQDAKRLRKQVERLQRKQKSGKMTAIITPYPISNCVQGEDITGAILRYMFCATGKIVKGLVRITNSIKGGAVVKVSIENDIGEESKTYIMSRQSILVEPDLDVYSGDRMTVCIFPDLPGEKITEVWLSFLWVPNIKEATLKHFLIEELEKDEGD